jgi:uncharacterized phage infection (PIP) family protein YhgE
MANATKTATKSATKSAQVAEIAAVSAVEGDAFANLTASQVKAARKGLDNLRASFASLARCEASVATAIGDLRKGGYHSAAKFTDFNAWVEAATNGDVSRSKAARYDLASQVVQACANSSLSDAVSGLSIDTLHRIAGKVKKDTADIRSTNERQISRDVKAREAVSAFVNAKKAGHTLKDCELAAGIAKPTNVQACSLDFEGMVDSLFNLAVRHARGNYGEAIQLLIAAAEKTGRAEEASAERAAREDEGLDID